MTDWPGGRTTWAPLWLAAVLVGSLLTVAAPSVEAVTAGLPTLTTPDFNGDGYADLAIGARDEDFPFPDSEVGVVNVLYGGPAGVTATGAQLWHQDIAGVDDEAELGDQFGHALAAGDFDADGFADLAVGVRGETLGFETQAGAVNVLYGSSAGLTATGAQFWHQDEPDVLDMEENFDHFGTALAAGDFDADGFADLAVGVSGEDIEDINSAGAVNVLFGSGAGLSAIGNQFVSQDSPGITGQANDVDLFGASLAAGDFGHNAADDLAVGVPNDDAGGTSAGAVNVLYGGGMGLSGKGDQLWSQASAGVDGEPALGDGFGWAVAAGDFGVDGHQDLAVGVPNDEDGTVVNAGAVNVLYGSNSGLSSTGSELWNQDVAGVEGVAEGGDHFGAALAAANLGKTGHDDLAVGVPDDKVGTVPLAGAVNVIYGADGGLAAAGDQIWSQDSAGILGASESGDDFGGALAAANFGNGGRADLAIGAPDDSILGTAEAGAINVLYGAASGLSSTGNQEWDQDSAGIPGTADESDHFGAAFSASFWIYVD